MCTNWGARDQRCPAPAERLAHCCGQVERGVTIGVGGHHGGAEAGLHQRQVRGREPVGMRCYARPEAREHLAGAERAHRRHGGLDHPRQQPPPPGMSDAHDPFGARQANGAAVCGEHGQGGIGAGGHGRVSLLSPVGAGAFDDDHPRAVDLAQPGPRGGRQ